VLSQTAEDKAVEYPPNSATDTTFSCHSQWSCSCC
jgi:hypothetical protein